MSERTRKTSFEDHLTMVTQSHTKTASAKPTQGQDMLSRLAAELGMTKSAADGEGAASVTAPAAPTAEGEKSPAAATPAAANPAVVSATEAVAVPQAVMAGMSNEEQIAGEVPAGIAVVTPIVGSGTGDAQTLIGFNRTDEATAAAAEGEGGVGPAAESAEAEKVGRLMAHAFNDELNKMAQANQYTEAVGILKEAGLLEGYNIKDEGIEKVAKVTEGFLEKIAENKSLTRDDIIGAANELIELQKQAEDAAEEGREEARALVKLAEAMEGGTEKVAQEEGEGEKEETEEEKKKREAEEAAAKEKEEGGEKVAALMKNPQIVAAVRVLKQHNLL